MEIKISKFISDKIWNAKHKLGTYTSGEADYRDIESAEKDLGLITLMLGHNDSDFNKEVSLEYIRWFICQINYCPERLCSYENFIKNNLK